MNKNRYTSASLASDTLEHKNFLSRRCPIVVVWLTQAWLRAEYYNKLQSSCSILKEQCIWTSASLKLQRSYQFLGTYPPYTTFHIHLVAHTMKQTKNFITLIKVEQSVTLHWQCRTCTDCVLKLLLLQWENTPLYPILYRNFPSCSPTIDVVLSVVVIQSANNWCICHLALNCVLCQCQRNKVSQSPCSTVTGYNCQP